MITYTYSAAGRVTQITDSASGMISRQYGDCLDAVTLQPPPQSSVANTYDTAGQRATMIYSRLPR